jgi:glutamate synthase domain-containing protein 1/glutamate synthase domain-containing protein 3
VTRPVEAEGGCGVTGFACTVPVSGKNIYEPSIQMRNRGNGKGGGIAACGLVPGELGVTRKVLDEDYILQIALLDGSAMGEVEKESILPYFDIDQGGLIPTVDDYREVELLDTRPPDVARYFVRVKPGALDAFAREKGLEGFPPRDVEDEFVFQNSTRINNRFYSSLGDKKAFVLSHARNLIILKIVGYAEAVVQYYRMADTRAYIWIAHQRYPTKGRVWHPGGAHPFIGMNEALVHNGDFANYHSVCEFLSQRNLFPLFLTDTEVSVLLFDLMNRVYKYPLEYIIEALAPTTELDFDRLPAEKQLIYREIQAVHTHAAPDGPWFFIIARTLADNRGFQLLGITDTAMLRPQVFALQEGEMSVSLICSEKQAIDATLASLSREIPKITPMADMYWNARGGSFNDGGTFVITVTPSDGVTSKGKENPEYSLTVTNKFGDVISTPVDQEHCDLNVPITIPAQANRDFNMIEGMIKGNDAANVSLYIRDNLLYQDYNWIRWLVDEIAAKTKEAAPALGIEALSYFLDRFYPTGKKKRSSLLVIFRAGLEKIFAHQPLMNDTRVSAYRRITWETRQSLRAPSGIETTLLIDARGFAPEGDNCDSRLSVNACKSGWKRIVHYNSRGTRFHGVGFGPSTNGLRIDCYDNPGDYLGSGMDGLELYVHCSAQDQLCQISKSGKLVIYGDVGQTFLYGAKGGDIYVLGNAAGRPMINAVGRPRVVINGTALDFLAESFMAGVPLKGGGFAIINGMRFDEQGRVVPLDLPYPGSNLLSLASGGAIYIRDPNNTLVDEQLNEGVYKPLSHADWKLILPYLEENERLFGIRIGEDLLTVDGARKPTGEVYKKVIPLRNVAIEKELEGAAAE